MQALAMQCANGETLQTANPFQMEVTTFSSLPTLLLVDAVTAFTSSIL